MKHITLKALIWSIFALFAGITSSQAYDWGDAPNSYLTVATNGGAAHFAVGTMLGSLRDEEVDGIPSPLADGDDLTGIDDEDGVVFATLLTAGAFAQIDVTVSGGSGYLNAWLDFNADGDWMDSGEQIFTDVPVSMGSTNLTILVPPTATIGVTFARFRVASFGGIPFGGGAPLANGEVEDYPVIIHEGYDWGDAPDPAYPTLAASLGAFHVIDLSKAFLGSAVDPETNGQPTVSADGDDLDLEGDDEDGVSYSLLVPGTTASITVTASSAGSFLQGWIDFDADGDWATPGDQIFTNVLLATGANLLSFSVPSGIAPGSTYGRFRLCTASDVPFDGGPAPDGEVEDYLFTIADLSPKYDWGDAPAVYPTLAAGFGAYHLIDTNKAIIGALIDDETDGQPLPYANGDDLNGIDDEDGETVIVIPWVPGGTASLTFSASMNGSLLQTWVDFNADGDWSDPGEQVFTNKVIVAGYNSLIFPIPGTAVTGVVTYLRFRLSTIPDLPVHGGAPDGEVEDLAMFFSASALDTPADLYDWGDAPDNPTIGTDYATLAGGVGPPGASHKLGPGVYMGTTVDADANGQPHSNAFGDDIDAGGDDEDGVFFAPIVRGTTGTVVIVAGPAGGMVDAWIDFDGSHSWSVSEKILSSVAVSPGLNTNTFSVPPMTALGKSFARFRISSAGGLTPNGAAVDGEVEDYRVYLRQPPPSAPIEIASSFSTSSNTVSMLWNAETDVVYQVQCSTNLLNTNGWTDVGSYVIGPVNWQTNSVGPEPEKFFRVTVPYVE